MSRNEIAELLDRYQRGECTELERAWVDTWFEMHGTERNSLEHMDEQELETWVNHLFSDIQSSNRQKEVSSLRALRKLTFSGWKMAAASVLLIGISIGLYFALIVGKSTGLKNQKMAAITDIAPGYNQATLTLSDGTTVDLDSAKSGVIVGDKEIIYDDGTTIDASIPHSSSITYHSLSTPRGGQYMIILHDGTKVWLNAASTLTYPSKFTGDTRTVELEGEAYFSVNHKMGTDDRVPFIVKSKNQQVTVLGTEFNISSYMDEDDVKTTLAHGVIQIANYKEGITGATHGPSDLKILKPGEQAININGKIQVKNVDPETEIAWKKGYFRFKNADVREVMRQISRWYDVDIIMSESAGRGNFSGEIRRSSTLAEVIRILKFGGVHVQTESNKKITVL